MKTKSSSLIVVLMVVVLSNALAAPVFAVSDDSIDSQHITEADGATGQDTDTGTGIKTGHIQDGAVTDAKISGTISASKISSAGLDADTVDGLHAADLAPAAHTHDQVDVNGLDGALAGKADAGHNHDGSYALAVHDHDELYQRHYNNVIVVSADGNGDFTDPSAAVSAIADASAANPYLVKIMPGVYDIGSGVLVMKSYVDIEGSGESVTRIKGAGALNNCLTVTNTSCLVKGAADAELRDLTIETYGYRIDVFAVIGYEQGGTFRIDNVTLDGRSSVSNRPGIYLGGSPGNVASIEVSNSKIIGTNGYSYGIYSMNSDTSVTVTNSRIEGRIYLGVVNYGDMKIANSAIELSCCYSPGYQPNAVNNHSDIYLTDVDLVAPNIGIQNYGNAVVVENSRVQGSVYAITGGANVAHSRIDGTLSGGGYKCLNVYDRNFNPITCQ